MSRQHNNFNNTTSLPIEQGETISKKSQHRRIITSLANKLANLHYNIEFGPAPASSDQLEASSSGNKAQKDNSVLSVSTDDSQTSSPALKQERRVYKLHRY